MDIGDWLRDLGFERYEGAFRENEVDARSLAFLTSDDLKEMGVVAIGHRRLLLNAIAELSAPAAAPPESRPLPAEPPRPGSGAQATAERRQLSVMFCDLVGSTQLAGRLDPEDMRDIITAYQHCIADIARRFDGYVAKFMGDGVLVYFGYPTAHEDDAERATRAALDMIAAMPDLGAASGETLQARVRLTLEGVDLAVDVEGKISLE